jgi:amino acid transporter
MSSPVPHAAPAGRPGLRRELGRWDLTAIGINQVIGGGVFLMPAAVAAHAGGWSPIVVAAMGGVSLLFALSFAEAASRFRATGGPYLFTRAAFGRFAGFEAGWMLWFTRAASWASVANGLADSLGYYAPALRAGAWRALVVAGAIAAVTAINAAGIRMSSAVINAFTVGKLLPLVVFIGAGLVAADFSGLAPGDPPGLRSVALAAVLLVFTFGGYEVVPVVAGESRDPRRAIPFALIMTIAVVTVVFTLAQLIAAAALPDLAGARTPLADAAQALLGPMGALLVTAGAVVSMSGNNVGQSLSGSRNLYALAEQGDIPSGFAYVHPRTRTPVAAIVFTGAVVTALALTGTFVTLAAGSAVSRLVVYALACASVPVLRRQDAARRARAAATERTRAERAEGGDEADGMEVAEALFTVPGGPVIPLAACGIAVAIVALSSARELTVAGAAFAVGAALYIAARLRERALARPVAARREAP